MKIDLEKLIAKLHPLAVWGARFALAERANLKVSFKNNDPNNYLTHVDPAIGDHIAKELAAEIADGLIIIDEEHLPKESPKALFAMAKKGWRPILIIDPIDGTRMFAQGNGGSDDWGVMLSLFYDGRVIYTTVIMPTTWDMVMVRNGELRLSGPMWANARPQKVARIGGQTQHLAAPLEQMGMKVEEGYSAAGMAMAIAGPVVELVTYPDRASIWDAAPVMAMAGLKVPGQQDRVAFFADEPQTPLVFGPEMVKPDWSLLKPLVVSTERVRQGLVAAMR